MYDSNVVQLGEFYFTSKIDYASELYYVCELGKYLSVNGFVLSLDGIILNTILTKSRFWDYFRIAITNGWIIGVSDDMSKYYVTDVNSINVDTVVNRLFCEYEYSEPEDIKERRDTDLLFDLSTPKKCQIVFSEKNDDVWVWNKGKTVEIETINSKAFSTNYISQCFISIIAYSAVERFKAERENRLSFKFLRLELDLTHLTMEHAVSDLLVLSERTNAIDWVDYVFNTDKERNDNLGYEAWLYIGRERGFVQREYSGKEKVENLKALGLGVGDIVGLYERKVTQRGSRAKSIVDFHFAVIDAINTHRVEVTLFNTIKTVYGDKKEFDELPSAVKQMFENKKNFSDMRVAKRNFEWSDVGAEYMLDDEKYFIAPLQGDDVMDDLLVLDRNNKEVKVSVNSIDYIHWLLKDHNYPFNENRFIKRYYDNDKPAYYKFYADNK